MLQQCSEAHVPVRATLVGAAAVEGLQHSTDQTSTPRFGAQYRKLVGTGGTVAAHLSGSHVASTDLLQQTIQKLTLVALNQLFQYSP
jgi:hypothetical protein